MAGASTQPLVASGNAKWWICALLLLATVLNYLDRQVLSLTAEKLMAEFHIDKEGFGHLLSSFRYSYAAFQLFGGWIVDAAGARLVFPLAVGLWSAAGLLTAFTRTLGGLSACRFLLGAGEAFNWPCALKTTERLLEPKDRPLANGLFNSGTAVGAMLAPVIVTVLANEYGWRSPFFFTGALGAAWIVLWAASMRGRSRQMSGESMPVRNVARVMAGIAVRREFWLLITSAVIINGVSYFLADWIPLYLKTERGFSFGAGNLLSIIVYAGLDAGNLVTGYFVRKIVSQGMSVGRARSAALLMSCICMSCSVLAGFTSRYLALACIVLTAIGVAGFLVIYLTAVQDIDPVHVGTTAGMLGGLGNLAYGFLSPYIGRVSDLHQTTLMFMLVGILPWAAYLSIARVVRQQQ